MTIADADISSEVTLVMWIDPAVGAIKYRLDRQPSVGDIKATHRFYFYSLLGILVFLALLFGFFYGESYWKASYQEADTSWLQGVCEKHLSDTSDAGGGGGGREEEEEKEVATHILLCQDVTKTIATFAKGDKMWLLHRKMQRGFGVKISSPPSLGEL